MSEGHVDVSPQALSIARAIDRACRVPGRYTITLLLPGRRQDAWEVEIARAEPLQRMAAGRRKRAGDKVTR